MCGICGIVWHGKRRVDPDESRHALDAMMSAMKHRGPDGSGVHLGQRSALGHLRLAVIDVASGAQPMSLPGKEMTLVFNGELYNFQDLKPDLSRQGWTFTTRSDTEVLLAGHALEGDAFDRKLNGMYAYARLDQLQGGEVITLAVDPVGIKPIYVAETSEATLFASELRGVIAGMKALGHSPQIDPTAVSQYLSLGWVPQPGTLLRGVRKLRPGERLRIHAADGLVENAGCDAPPKREQPVGLEELEDGVIAALRRQMIADVPLGFFLSGGVDSSLLVALASELGVEPRTFTVRFAGEGHGVSSANEADIARQVAQTFGAHHHECVVDANVLASHLDETFEAMDQPIADPACLPLLLLSRFAREQVTVCLSGDGGDELFAGYPRHQLADWKQKWRAVPSAIRGPIRVAGRLLPQAPSTGAREFLRKGGVALRLVDDESYFPGPFSGERGRGLSPAPVLPAWARDIPYDGEAMMMADLAGELSGQMLPKTDHISMWCSLECRVPLLDLELIRMARAMPLEMKRQGATGKIPLREILARRLPAHIANRPKHGFRVPLTTWFRGELSGMVRERLLSRSEVAAGVVSHREVGDLVEAHLTGAEERSIQIWSLLALQAWIDRHDLG